MSIRAPWCRRIYKCSDHLVRICDKCHHHVVYCFDMFVDNEGIARLHTHIWHSCLALEVIYSCLMFKHTSNTHLTFSTEANNVDVISFNEHIHILPGNSFLFWETYIHTLTEYEICTRYKYCVYEYQLLNCFPNYQFKYKSFHFVI